MVPTSFIHQRDGKVAIHLLFVGGCYGTERATLALLGLLQAQMRQVLVTPPGYAAAAAQQHYADVWEIKKFVELPYVLSLLLANEHGQVNIISTAVGMTLAALGVSRRAARGNTTIHHIVHGGNEERDAYAGCRTLNPFDVEIVAVSNYVRERLLYFGVWPEKIKVVENFLPTGDFVQIVRRKPYLDPPTRAITVGRLVRSKAPDVVVQAAHMLSQHGRFTFDFVGDGELKAELTAQAIASPVIRIRGECSNLSALYHKYDLLVHASPTEAFGLVLLEAMAAGVIVLYPSSGAPRTFLRDGVTGFQYESGSPRALAEKVSEVSRLPSEFLNIVARKAREMVEQHYTSGRARSEYAAILKLNQTHS